MGEAEMRDSPMPAGTPAQRGMKTLCRPAYVRSPKAHGPNVLAALVVLPLVFEGLEDGLQNYKRIILEPTSCGPPVDALPKASILMWRLRTKR